MLGTRTAGISARASSLFRRRPNGEMRLEMRRDRSISGDHYQQWKQPEKFYFNDLDYHDDRQHGEDELFLEEFLCGDKRRNSWN